MEERQERYRQIRERIFAGFVAAEDPPTGVTAAGVTAAGAAVVSTGTGTPGASAAGDVAPAPAAPAPIDEATPTESSAPPTQSLMVGELRIVLLFFSLSPGQTCSAHTD